MFKKTLKCIILYLSVMLAIAGFSAECTETYAYADVQTPGSLGASAAAREVTRSTWTYKPPPHAFCKPISTPSSLIDTKMLLALRQQHAKLSMWSAELDRKKTVIAGEELALSKQLAALRLVQTNLTSLEVKQDHRKNAQWQSLSTTYKAMQARDAGKIFNKLDPRIVIGILEKMDARHSAAILAAMTPSAARSATEALAGVRSSAAADALPLETAAKSPPSE
jgi:flagellar motility protein MotE (MotC chaperone)